MLVVISFLDTIVTVVTATDADETATVNYVLDTASSPSSYSTYFTLDGDTIKLQETVDLDPPLSAASIFYLVVLAKDGGTPEQTGTTTVIVSVKASNEETPSFAAGPYTVNDVSTFRPSTRVDFTCYNNSYRFRAFR